MFAGFYAFINHSCVPNASADLQLAARCATMHFIATESIPMSREIKIAYTPIYYARQERSQQLRTQFGFDSDCKCVLCAIETMQTAENGTATKYERWITRTQNIASLSIHSAFELQAHQGSIPMHLISIHSHNCSLLLRYFLDCVLYRKRCRQSRNCVLST
jgi:hypothetical protein